MRRGRRNNERQLSQIRIRIDNLLNSPLKELGAKLGVLLEKANSWEMEESDRVEFIDYLSYASERLPTEFDDRFFFDAYMIQSIAASWEGSRGRLGMLIPTYQRSEWLYEYISLPGTIHGYHLIYIPRSTNETLPELLDYSWLCHEMGHYLFNKNGQGLIDNFQRDLDILLRNLRLGTLADQGIARKQSQTHIENVQRYWDPTRGWPRELMIDFISLWTCGPAYASAFCYEHKRLKPFIIQKSHPPVALRTQIMLRAAQELGWKESVEPLEELLQEWQHTLETTPTDSIYSAMHNSALIDAVVQVTLDYATTTDLPRLKPYDISQMRTISSELLEVDNGIDLIVSAWCIYTESGTNAYEAWTKQIFRTITDEITL